MELKNFLEDEKVNLILGGGVRKNLFGEKKMVLLYLKMIKYT